jgi:hypothetical protein
MDGRKNEERSDRPSVVSENLDQIVDKKMYVRRDFTISEVSREFPQISHTAL